MKWRWDFPTFLTKKGEMAVLKARTEFASALNQICAEKGIEPEVALESIKSAVVAAYRKDYGANEEMEYEVDLDMATGEFRVYEFPEGKEKKKKEVTPPGFGRIASMTAKQVIIQKLREAEKTAILDEYSKRVGTLVSGMIIRFDGPNAIVDIGKAEGVMSPPEQVRSERYKVNQRLTFLIKEIRDTLRGREVIVSRADPGLVESLFRREVPEVASGAVEVKVIAREGGGRTKMAVSSTQLGVDPVGSCVGQKGVRVQAVIDELEGEKIDVIQYSDDPEKFIIAALSPAEGIKVELDEKRKEAVVSMPDDQLSLAIGREGQNVRLAAKLTGFRIDIKGTEKAEKKETKEKKKKTVSELTALGLSTRTVSALEAAGIKTKKKLASQKDKVTEIKGIGPKAAAEIKKALK
ncbi:MAG: transcription termination factor NusA [Candidatus Marinimicrobia bacterium]|nr:transcription termination factor NusA [Candidatus Neomarinimicrobiota bacterium]